MKKQVSILLSLLLLFSLVQTAIIPASTAEAAEDTRSYLINDDFEDETVGNIPDGYIHSTSVAGITTDTSAVYVDTVPEASATGNSSLKALRLFDNDGAKDDPNEPQRSRTIVTKGFDRQMDNFVVELDFMEPKAVNNSYPIRLIDTVNNKTGLVIEISSGKFIYDDGTRKEFEQSVSLEANKWYHIKIFVDVASNAADVYIDGILVGNAPFKQQVEGLDALEAWTAGTSVGDLFWDNLQVYVDSSSSDSDNTDNNNSSVDLIRDDFEDEALNSRPDGYLRKVSNSSAPVETNDVFVDVVPEESAATNSSSKSLSLIDNDDVYKSRTMVSKTFDRQTGGFVVEIDVMEPKAVGNTFPIILSDSSGTAVSIEISGGKFGYRGSDNIWTPLLLNGESISMDGYRWYHFKILADVMSNTAYIYLDDTYLGDIPFKDGVDGISTLEAWTAGTSQGGLYWDNVHVYVEAADSPKNLKHVFGDQQVKLSWNAANGASSYSVKRSTVDGGPYDTIASGITATGYLDSGLTNETTYYYVVTAVSAAGESEPSNQVSATPTEIPNPPDSPVGLKVMPRNSQVDLSWSPPSSTDGLKMLFVGAEGIPSDDLLINYFKDVLGFQVTFQAAKPVTNPAPDSYAADYDLLFVSESTSSGDVREKFEQLDMPIVYGESWAMDEAKLSSEPGGHFENADTIKIVSKDHPLAANLSGEVKVYSAPDGSSNKGNINHGVPSEDATVIAVYEENTVVEDGGQSQTLFIVGDSTASNYSDQYAPRAGWGQVIDQLLTDYDLTVKNYARSGRSSKSFYDEGYFNFTNEMKENDLLIIQFGHNDNKPGDEARYTEPYTTYQEYLSIYIDEARKRGAIPVLATSVHRNKFDGETIVNTHGNYPDAMRQLAAEKNVPLIDVTEDSKVLFESLGPERVKQEIFLHLAPGESDNYPDGVEDNTHFRESGAVEIAKLVVAGLEENNLLEASDTSGDSEANNSTTVTVSKPAIYAYEQGDKRVDGTQVPDRRVVIFAHADYYPYLTNDGWDLIDVSVKWALGMSGNEATPVDMYKVKRSTNPGGPYIEVAEVEGTEYRDFGLDNDTTYYYVVTSVNIGGESAPSMEKSVTVAAPLFAPTGLAATPEDKAVTISWNPVEGADSYDVKRSSVKGLDYKLVRSGVTGTEFTDVNLINGTRYYYVVSAASSTSASTNSEPVSAVPAPQNGAPDIPVHIEAEAGNGSVFLKWPNVTGADTYNIKRGAYGSGQYDVIASISISSYLDTDVVNGETYDYVISAINVKGESYNSEPVAVSPAQLVIVAKDGSGDFETVQAAINAAPNNSSKRHVIYIKNGEYREKITVPASKTKLSLVGESAEGTVLVYHDNANTPDGNGGTIGTFNSASIFIDPNDFIAKNLTIQNDSGQGTGQAVAAHIKGDRAYFENVRFLGYQDTVLTNGERHYFKDCYIEGDVDFIFGKSTAVFDNCQIHSKRNGSKLTAASTPETSPFGYVFLNSVITSDEGINNVHLGRPWRPFAAVAFIDTVMDSSIAPYGWDNWSDVANEKTARYSEYNSSGSGANPQARAGWTKQLTPEEANQYTVQNVLKGGDGWDPARIDIIPTSDVLGPIITVDQQNGYTNKAGFKVSGKMNAAAIVTVNGEQVNLQEDLTFSTTVQLQTGENMIAIEAINEDGEPALPVFLKIVYDNESPVLTLDEPAGEKDGDHYNTFYNPYPVSGKVSEAGIVKINGQQFEVTSDLIFNAEVGLNTGMNEITVIAEDLAGNVSEPASIKVNVAEDSVPPGPVQIIKAEVTGTNTFKVTFNSRLVNFNENDFQVKLAMGQWMPSLMDAELTATAIKNVSTHLNGAGQTVAIFEIEQALTPDGTFTKPGSDDPANIPLLKASYYSGDRDKDIQQADYLISWQIDHGGWDKNKEDTDFRRMWDGTEAKSSQIKNGVELGTVDNDATINEILFLTLVYNEYGYEPAKEAALKGINYVLEAQYESGGWPQFYPARGNYSDYVTFNDHAMIRVMNALTLVSEKKYPFNTDLINAELAEQAQNALDLGLDYILKAQIVVNGVPTAWCAQHDPVTYEPKEARIYEHPSISGDESVGIIKYLMSLANPSAEVQAAIETALDYFDEVELEGIKYVHADPDEIYFYADPDSSTWYRFYEIGTNRPIFSGRDGVIKYSIHEIEKERRDGYRFAGTWPQLVLEYSKTTGYYENHVYVEIVGQNSQNIAGEVLELGKLFKVGPESETEDPVIEDPGTEDPGTEPVDSGITIQLNGHVDLSPSSGSRGPVKKLHIQSELITGTDNSITGDASIKIMPQGIHVAMEEVKLISLDSQIAVIQLLTVSEDGSFYTVRMSINGFSDTTGKPAQYLSIMIWEGTSTEGEAELEVTDLSFKGNMKIIQP